MKIEQGTPPADGLYVGYVAYHARPDALFPLVVVYGKETWWFSTPGQKCTLAVQGWIGPLPAWDAMHTARDADWLRDAGMKPVKPLEFDL